VSQKNWGPAGKWPANEGLEAMATTSFFSIAGTAAVMTALVAFAITYSL
jgi:hypothetical protein